LVLFCQFSWGTLVLFCQFSWGTLPSEYFVLYQILLSIMPVLCDGVPELYERIAIPAQIAEGLSRK